jgi:hypothetical protein
MGVPEIEAFLALLAVEGNASGSPQNQALNAPLFLYRKWETSLYTIPHDCS